MIDEKKVMLMTRMASYESNEGREDLKISAYYRSDYVGLHIVYAVIWATIGYGCLAALAVICMFDKLMDSMSMNVMVGLGIAVIIGYIITLIIYAAITYVIYNRKHQRARMRVKKYNHDLARLLKIYEKENR